MFIHSIPEPLMHMILERERQNKIWLLPFRGSGSSRDTWCVNSFTEQHLALSKHSINGICCLCFIEEKKPELGFDV